ncbi:MAG: maleylpyruvate isomerase family mycothiol-dependent enzyme, partial [Actinomycetota bacterium]|nr:maleylpyruvate isomerase family mycothiol-dependent enzyme [Actinomycetota bacterium]
MDDTRTWNLIHQERVAMADTLAALTPGQWAEPSLCGGWSVQVAAGHIVVGAEQTPTRFLKRMAANGFRFNTMMDRDARRVGALPPAEIIDRLRARVTTTNRPPAPVMTMLGEIVVHGEDIRHPLGLGSDSSQEAIAACLEMYTGAGFPVGTKKRISGLRLVATDTDWKHGAGPEISGPGSSLLLAMTGRPAGLDGLAGEGLATLRRRMMPT